MDEFQRKQRELHNQSQQLNAQLEAVQKKQAELDRIHEDHVSKLEHISGMSALEAKEQLIESMRDDATSEAMTLIRDIVDEAKLTANTEAKKIVIETIQRTAAEHAIENTVTVFNIESDEIKGRISGRSRHLQASKSSLTTAPMRSCYQVSTQSDAKSPVFRCTN
jgi:ribonuclease Y